MTAPYKAKVAELITGSLRHEVAVTAVTRTGARYPLDVTDGDLSVTFAEDWAPYGQVKITAAIPADQETLDVLDPRLNCQLEILAGYTYPDTERDVWPLGTFGLRSRPASRPAGTLSLNAATDEARAQDYKIIWSGSGISRAGLNEAATWCIGYALAPAVPQIISEFPAGSFADDLDNLEINVGEDLWNALDDIAGRTGARIYCDEHGVWRIVARPELAGTPAHTLETGPAGTIVSTDADLSREDGWANAVVVRHRWTPEGAPGEISVQGYAGAASGPYAISAVGYCTYFEAGETPITTAQANKKAATRLKNLITRGRALELTSIAAYWLRPGMTVLSELPTGEPEKLIVQSITFHPLTGLMDLKMRQPLDVIITSGE